MVLFVSAHGLFSAQASILVIAERKKFFLDLKIKIQEMNYIKILRLRSFKLNNNHVLEMSLFNKMPQKSKRTFFFVHEYTKGQIKSE